MAQDLQRVIDSPDTSREDRLKARQALDDLYRVEDNLTHVIRST